MTEYTPCPFCASTAMELRHNENLAGMETIGCRNCGARGPHVETARHATAAWNTRALSQALPAPGEVEANLEAQRQAIEACARIADIHAEPTDTPEDFTQGYEMAARKIARSIRKLCPNESLATVAAANDEGVAEAFARGVEAAAKVAERWMSPSAELTAPNLPAAIRILSQGERK